MESQEAQRGGKKNKNKMEKEIEKWKTKNQEKAIEEGKI